MNTLFKKSLLFITLLAAGKPCTVSAGMLGNIFNKTKQFVQSALPSAPTTPTQIRDAIVVPLAVTGMVLLMRKFISNRNKLCSRKYTTASPKTSSRGSLDSL